MTSTIAANPPAPANRDLPPLNALAWEASRLLDAQDGYAAAGRFDVADSYDALIAAVSEQALARMDYRPLVPFESPFARLPQVDDEPF